MCINFPIPVPTPLEIKRPKDFKMSPDEIIANALKDVLGYDRKISGEMTAADFQNWDSFNNIKIMLQIETLANVKFDTGQLSEIKIYPVY